MQLVERHIIVNDKAIEALCHKAKNLYNQTLYYLRQATFGKIEFFSEYELSGLFAEFNQEDFRALPSNCSQQIIRLVFMGYKSWHKARKEFINNPSKFSGKPKLPGYKKSAYMVLFTTSQVRLRHGYIRFPKMTNIKPLKTKVQNFCQVRIVPKATCYVIEVIYNKEPEIHENLKPENFLSIDLGLDNLATCVNNVGVQPFIVNGKMIKSVNQIYNKTRARLMSYVGDRGTSNRIKKLTLYRNNYIEDKLHKISRYIVNDAISHDIGTIILGYNKGWKTGINIGKINNQKFVAIAFSRLIDKIAYKCKLVGIELILNEESYTSKIDHLAFEPMIKQEEYVGKRKHRGLFQSSTGKLLNADVNGAIGIARKVVGDSAVKQIIDSGLAFNPVKLNVA